MNQIAKPNSNTMKVVSRACVKKTFVYFVQAGYTGPIKIGIAIDVGKRIIEMQVGNHMELMLIAKVGPYSRKKAEHIEESLHKKFKYKSVRGEWFDRDINLKGISELDISENADSDWYVLSKVI